MKVKDNVSIKSVTDTSRQVLETKKPKGLFSNLQHYFINKVEQGKSKSESKNYKVLKKRVSVDHQLNFDKLSPYEKIYVGAVVGFRKSSIYQLHENRKREEALKEQYTKRKNAIIKIANLINKDYSDKDNPTSEIQMLMNPEYQTIIPDLKGYFPSWQIEIEKVNPQINHLVSIPILIKFKRRDIM